MSLRVKDNCVKTTALGEGRESGLEPRDPGFPSASTWLAGSLGDPHYRFPTGWWCRQAKAGRQVESSLVGAPLGKVTSDGPQRVASLGGSGTRTSLGGPHQHE